jgi:hypothetical protein
MGKLLFMPLLLLQLYTSAQSDHAYWSVGLNPLGIGEIISAVGPCASYRVSPHLELWIEWAYLFEGPWGVYKWRNIKGYRLIFQPRYYIGKSKRFFLTPEFRLKHYSYNSVDQFINPGNGDTLNNQSYHGSQFLTGGAFILGEQLVLSRRHNLHLEVTIGLGSKYRQITRTKIPDGYFFNGYTSNGIGPAFSLNGINSLYVPLGFRLIWKLNR